MPTENHFTAEILNLTCKVKGLDLHKNYYYDGLNNNGLIQLDYEDFDKIIEDKIIHLLIYFINNN